MRNRLAPTVRAIALVACWLAAATTLLAHHGWGEYDSRTPLTLTGTIKTSGYENPHAFIDIEVDGKTWHAVLAPPSRMQSRG